jgi:RNA polymerase sporulation-specific sigma factor
MGDKDMDDLISIGTIGLIKGIDTFDDTKNIRLATYAARCIDNELLMMLRSEKKSAKDVHLYDSIGSDKEGNEISLMDVIEYTDEDVVERVTKEEHIAKLEEYLRRALSPREQEIIRMRYGLNGREEKTQREIAQLYGISRSYVSRIEKKALEKLRKCYEK